MVYRFPYHYSLSTANLSYYNLLTNSPHTAADFTEAAWYRPYSR